MVKVTAETVKVDGEEKIRTSVEIGGYARDLVDEATAAIEAIVEGITSRDESLTKAFKAGMTLRLMTTALGIDGKEKN